MIEQDRELLRLEAPWPLPNIVIAIIKSGSKRRWATFFRLITGEATDGAYYYDFIWLLQIRAWWFPVFFHRGWVRRD